MKDPKHHGSCHWSVAPLSGVRQLSEPHLLQPSPAFLYVPPVLRQDIWCWWSIQASPESTQATQNFTYEGHNSYSHCGVLKLPTGEIHNDYLTRHRSPRGKAGPGGKLITSGACIIGRAAHYSLWNRHLFWINTCFSC